MLVATDDDLVIGMCMHYEMVPTPAPTPTPIPHPFMAMISDPSRKAVQALTGPMKAGAGEPPPDRPFVTRTNRDRDGPRGSGWPRFQADLATAPFRRMY